MERNAPEIINNNEEWINGGPLKISQLRGKIVLIKFWTFMCSWCQEDLPKIMALESKFKDDGLVVLGIHTPETSFERDVEALKKQMQVLKVDFPVLTDNLKQNWKAYKVENWPSYFLINQNGKIVFEILGPKVEQELEGEIKKLIKRSNE